MGDLMILIATKLSSIVQRYTKDAGQDIALEQLIQPTIPSYTGKIQSAWNRLAQIKNIYKD